MSNKPLIKLISKRSRNPTEPLEKWSSMNILKAGIFKFGNIRVSIGVHSKETLIGSHIKKNKRFMANESFCNNFHTEDRLSMIKFPNVTYQPELWHVYISDINLLHMWAKGNYNQIRPETIQDPVILKIYLTKIIQ